MHRPGAVRLTVALLAVADGGAASPSPVALFDGRSLTGWEQGDRSTFRVERGIIVGGNLVDPVARKTFLCTIKRYANFRLSAQFRLDGAADANTGIQFRTERLDRVGASEVSGYQADAGQMFWGTLYDEGRRDRTLVKVDQTRLTRHVNDGKWNTYAIVAQGRRVSITFNGVRTIDYVEPDESIPLTGHICLQVHNGKPMKAEFRRITLSPL